MTHTQAVEQIKSAGLQGPCHGNLNRVKELVDADPSLVEAMNAIDPRQVDETPQGAAAHTHSRRILEYLRDKGVRVDICMAAALGDAQRVGEMLRADPSQTAARGAHGIPLIAHAADAPVAETMIAGGVACDIFMAAQLGVGGHVEKLVREDRERLNARAPLTPLQLAMMYQHKSVVKMLLDVGAEDPDGAGRWFLNGPELCDKDQAGTSYSNINLGGASFRNVNLGHSTFENINFRGAAFFNVNMSDVNINWCSIEGLKIMGVEVQPLIDAELKRRGHPG